MPDGGVGNVAPSLVYFLSGPNLTMFPVHPKVMETRRDCRLPDD